MYEYELGAVMPPIATVWFAVRLNDPFHWPYTSSVNENTSLLVSVSRKLKLFPEAGGRGQGGRGPGGRGNTGGRGQTRFRVFSESREKKPEPSREGATGGLDRASGFPFPL